LFDDSGGTYVPTRENRVLAPAQMIAAGDTVAVLPLLGAGRTNVTPADLLWISSPYTFPAYGAAGVGNWHNGGANMVFCDGHVQYAKQAVWMEASHERRRLWNSDNQPHPENW